MESAISMALGSTPSDLDAAVVWGLPATLVLFAVWTGRGTQSYILPKVMLVSADTILSQGNCDALSADVVYVKACHNAEPIDLSHPNPFETESRKATNGAP